MSIEQTVRTALAANAEGPRDSEPDIDGLLRRGRRRQRRRTAGVVGVAATVLLGLGLGLSTLPERAGDLPSASGPSADDAVPTVSTSWGPDGAFLSVDGVPYIGTRKWPQVDQIGSFTVVDSGVVYVDPKSSEIVWEGWDHRTRVLGQDPWHLVDDPADDPYPRTNPLRPRHLVGDPVDDVVAWIKTARDGGRGDLVVVRPSSGEELARAAVPVPADHDVLIASVGGGDVHVVSGDNLSGTHLGPPQPRWEQRVWAWHWAAGEPPVPDGRGGRDFTDASGDVWAAYDQDLLRFEDASGRQLSQVPASFGDRIHFDGLSPDGRFWYGPAHGQVVETATGQLLDLPARMGAGFAWTGATELTLIGGPSEVQAMAYQLFTRCDVVSGRCTEPFEVPAPSSCGVGEPFCGHDLPSY